MRSLFSALLLMLALPALAGDQFRIETVAEGLDHPWAVAWLPDGRMLVTERSGQLRLIDESGLQEEPVGGLPDAHVRSQAGLFHVLPAEDFDDSGLIYLTLAEGDRARNTLVLIRGRLQDRRLEEIETLFRVEPWRDTSVHYGARLAWLADGSLLLSSGDGADFRYQAQRPEDHFGSVLRLDADGGVPGDNPFADADDDVRSETWTIGHRNVQGLAQDPETGVVWASEHGPRGGDRLHRLEPGANYGWPVTSHAPDYSGARISPYREYPGMEPPVHVWERAIAPGGLAVYRGELFPDWGGDLLVPGLVSRAVHRLRVEAGVVLDEQRLFRELDRRLRAVEVGPDGAIYLLTDHSNGELLRVVPGS